MQLLDKDRHNSLVAKVKTIVAEWKLSPFENEGACRTGIRQALCEEGYGWAASDDAAASIVAEALRSIGAVRPSWEQGQRQYVIPEENCNWCGRDLDEPEGRDRRGRFCSAECAKAAITLRDYETSYWNDRVGAEAFRIVRRAAQPQRACEHCGTAFHIDGPWDNKRHCSLTCSDKSKMVAPRICANPACQTPFQASTGNQWYCSGRCRAQCGRVTTYDKTCGHCGKDFVAKSITAKFCSLSCKEGFRVYRDAAAAGRPVVHPGEPVARECNYCGVGYTALSLKSCYCSKGCRNLAQWERDGKPLPRDLRAATFDHYLTMPINAARPLWLTPERFDEMVPA